MLCIHCERPAVGACRFCGRAACREHFNYLPYILEIYQGADGSHRAIAIEETLHCGICQPQEEPVVAEEYE